MSLGFGRFDWMVVGWLRYGVLRWSLFLRLGGGIFRELLFGLNYCGIDVCHVMCSTIEMSCCRIVGIHDEKLSCWMGGYLILKSGVSYWIIPRLRFELEQDATDFFLL